MQADYHTPAAGKRALRPEIARRGFDEGEKRLQGRLAELLRNDVAARVRCPPGSRALRFAQSM